MIIIKWPLAHVVALMAYAKCVKCSHSGGRVGPGRAMPDQQYGPEIINDAILYRNININQLIISY